METAEVVEYARKIGVSVTYVLMKTHCCGYSVKKLQEEFREFDNGIVSKEVARVVERFYKKSL